MTSLTVSGNVTSILLCTEVRERLFPESIVQGGLKPFLYLHGVKIKVHVYKSQVTIRYS